MPVNVEGKALQGLGELRGEQVQSGDEPVEIADVVHPALVGDALAEVVEHQVRDAGGGGGVGGAERGVPTEQAGEVVEQDADGQRGRWRGDVEIDFGEIPGSFGHVVLQDMGA